MKLNDQIAYLRREKGITQEELASVLGVSNQAVSKWESAQCCPDITLLPELAKYFNVSVDKLLGYENSFENSAENIYVTAVQIAEESGLSESSTVDCLEDLITDYLSEKKEKGTTLYRINGRKMYLLPLLTMLSDIG